MNNSPKLAMPFLHSIETITLSQHSAVLMIAKFEMTAFRTDLYFKHGIPIPASFQGSTPARRAEFLAGRILSKAALDFLNYSQNGTVDVGPGRAPIWPVGITGSISHDSGNVAVLLTRNASLRLGIDITRAPSKPELDAVRELALVDVDRALCSLTADLCSDISAMLIFSGKETFFKAFYRDVGHYFDFDCACADSIELPSTLRLTLTKDLSPKLSAGMNFLVQFRIEEEFLVTWMIA